MESLFLGKLFDEFRDCCEQIGDKAVFCDLEDRPEVAIPE
jgi:hypothetical protein